MLSRETMDDLHIFAEKLLAEQEMDSVKSSVADKRESSMITSNLDDLSGDQPVAASYKPQSSYVAKSS